MSLGQQFGAHLLGMAPRPKSPSLSPAKNETEHVHRRVILAVIVMIKSDQEIKLTFSERGCFSDVRTLAVQMKELIPNYVPL